jgi:ArsR family transcriptional regulator, virulence genes transcriptional regulator
MDVKRFDLSHLDLAAARASDLIKALAHPSRLRIVCALAQRERSVTELAEIAGAPVATISRHLARLRRERIVKARRARQSLLYSLGDDRVAKLVTALVATFCAADIKSKRKSQ